MPKAKVTEMDLQQNLIKRKKEKAHKKMSPGAMSSLEKSKETSKIKTAEVAAVENHYDCGAFAHANSNRGK